MPKEVIHAASLPYGDEDPSRSVIELRWDREAGHIQLATKCVHLATGEVYVPSWVRELLSRKGLKHTQEIHNSDDDVVYLAQDGWYIDLDRYAINKLIRNLRRARDQAFGRDE